MKRFLSKINPHYFFVIILSLNYVLPILIFNNITLFYHDALDHEIVYNKILGKVLSNGIQELEIFLNGQIEIEFLRRVFHPITYLYYFFNFEIAYWITDISLKIISYLAFYTLAKKISVDKFNCCLVAALYASINLPTHLGIGFAIIPYLIYLINFKKFYSLKNYFIIILAGINSDIVTIIYSIPIILILSLVLNHSSKQEIFKRYILVISIFSLFLSIANFNLILLYFGDLEIHRVEFFKEYYSLKEFIINFFINFFYIKDTLNWTFFYDLPTLIFIPFLYLSFFFIEDKKLKILFIIIIFINLIVELINLELFGQIKNYLFGSLNFGYIRNILPIIYCISALIALTYKNFFLKKTLILVLITSLFVSQINSSIVPFYKQFLMKEINYRNIYTFKDYYLYDDYKKLKKIVKNKRTISIGIDPMIAIANDIATIDGYHNIYPLNYKKKFRRIIDKELEKNLNLKKYYDNWGSRLYVVLNNPNEVLINFNEAKNLGAEFVISAHNLNIEGLQLICDQCSNYVKLYYIE